MEQQEAAPEAEVLETTPAPEAPAASSEPPKEAEPAEKPRKNRRSYEQRIAQLTAQLRQTERTLEETRKPPEPAEPKRDDFEDYESYVKAISRHEAKQAAAERISEAERQAAKRDEQAQEIHTQAQRMAARESALERGNEVYSDFEEVVSQEDLSITPVMADAILVSEKGHELWYHLGKHPELADRIAGMSPVQQLMELGRLESTLSGKKASAAPPPTTTLNPRGANANALSDRLGIDEWMRKRREEVRKHY